MQAYRVDAAESAAAAASAAKQARAAADARTSGDAEALGAIRAEYAVQVRDLNFYQRYCISCESDCSTQSLI